MSNQYKAKRKLSKNEQFDVATMIYFIPNNVKSRIYPNDKIKMADLSSKGIKPNRITKGFTLLQWGKTYRDEQITSYRRDISLGLFTKIELLDSMPPKLKNWLWSKIKDVPYDVDGSTVRMWHV
jgi:hypothetical protein